MDADPLRNLIRKEMTRRGLSAAALARSCGQPYWVYRYFLAGTSQHLRRPPLEALADYLRESIDHLIDLQGGITAEDFQHAAASRTMTRFHAEYPKGHPRLKEAARKRGEKRKGYPQSDSARRALAAFRADPERRAAALRNQSRAWALRLAEDETAASWVRWAAERLLDQGMTKAELADRCGVKRKTIYDQLGPSNKRAPMPATIQRLEAILGPMPRDAKIAIGRRRSEVAGGRKSQKRLKQRTEKWNRDKLLLELKGLGVVDPWNLVKHLPPNGALGRIAYKIFGIGKAEAMRGKSPPAPLPRKVPGTNTTPRGVLSLILHGLRRQNAPTIYQCQYCGQVWRKQALRHKGILCGPCWRRHMGVRVGKLRWEQSEPPTLPKRSGRRVEPGELQRRVILLLSQSLGYEAGLDDLDWKHIRDTENRLRESGHPWCVRVAANLAELS